MIISEVEALYTIRPAAIDAAAACMRPAETVFLTSDSELADWTTGVLMSVGRTAGAFKGAEEVRLFVLSVATDAIGGWLIGWLDIDLTTRGRS